MLAPSFRGTIIGDFIGSAIEGATVSSSPYPETIITGNRFNTPRANRVGEKLANMPLIVPGCKSTDDTALACAVAEHLMYGIRIEESYRAWAAKPDFPDQDFGKGFMHWFKGNSTTPSTSHGNGCCMRLGPVIDAFSTQPELLKKVLFTVRPTHSSVEAGFCASLLSLIAHRASLTEDLEGRISLCLKRINGPEIDLKTPLAERRSALKFSTKAIDTVPLAIRVSLESTGFEDSIRRALSLGHDTDTIAAMTAMISARCWEIPPEIWSSVEQAIPACVNKTLHDFEKWLGEKY